MTRIKILELMVLAVVLLPNTAPAQPPDTLWTKTYGGSGRDVGYSVAQTTDGGFIIAGWTYSYGAGIPDSSNIYLIKTDANGDTFWTNTYGGRNNDYGYSLAQTNDDGFIIAGITRSFGKGTPQNPNVYLIKTDTDGDTLWTRTYGGGDYVVGYSVKQTTDGGYIIAGWIDSYGTGAGEADVYLIKTNAQGETLWTKTYGGSGFDEGYSVAQTTDGGYVIAGETQSYGAGNGDVFLIKTNANGDTLWTKTYGGGGDEYCHSVVQTSEGGYVIIGAYNKSYREYDIYLIRTDANGDSLWTKTYGGSDTDEGYSVVQTSDGGYIIASGSRSYGAGEADVYLIKTNADGETLWTKTFGGSDNDGGRSVAQTSDGGYIVAGYTASYGVGDRDVYLIRLGPETGVEENSNLNVKSPNLIISQNPFSKTTTISYQIPEKSEVSLSVFDVTGREIKKAVDGVQERGDYHLQLDMTGYAEGVYFITFAVGKARSVRKVIVLK